MCLYIQDKSDSMSEWATMSHKSLCKTTKSHDRRGKRLSNAKTATVSV